MRHIFQVVMCSSVAASVHACLQVSTCPESLCLKSSTEFILLAIVLKRLLANEINILYYLICIRVYYSTICFNFQIIFLKTTIFKTWKEHTEKVL